MGATKRSSIESIPTEKVAQRQRRIIRLPYNAEALENAVVAYKEGESSSIRQAAKEHGVAYQTLRDRIVKGDALNVGISLLIVKPNLIANDSVTHVQCNSLIGDQKVQLKNVTKSL